MGYDDTWVEGRGQFPPADDGLTDVRMPGVNWSGRTVLWAEKAGAEGHYIVIKRFGGRYWSSLGAPFKYAPAEFMVYRVVQVHGQSPHRRWDVERLVDFPIRKGSG